MMILDEKRAVSDSQSQSQHRAPSRSSHESVSWRGRLSYITLGLASLAWLGLRSGTRPTRLVYPCQRIAATSGLGLLTYTVAVISTMRVFRYARRYLTLRRIGLLIFSLMLVVLLRNEALVFSTSARNSRVSPALDLPTWTSPDAITDVFAVTNVPTPTVSLDGGVIPEGVSPAEALHEDGVDALVNLMASQGTFFYETVQQPQGIIGSDDVVVIKVNNQWNCRAHGAESRRSHTNNDAVKGLIYRIVQHPEGFTGAVIVTDNGQGAAEFDCADHNNAQDAHQSYQDVADAFASQGYDVCTYDWDDLNWHFVSEYDSGDVESGYVLLQDGTPGVNQLSYPKFDVTCGSRTYQISMRYGLWDGASYDNNGLKMINFPIVKRHTTAGATISVKNYIGFLTTSDLETRFGDRNTMHGFFWGVWTGSDYGLLGRQLALIRRADLEIVDAIWVNPSDQGGGASEAVRDNILLASTDPFAVDYYTSAYVLVPHLLLDMGRANKADARYHGGEFRRLLMTNENRARLKGMTDIIDLDDSFTAEEEQAQFNAFVADASTPPTTTLPFSLTAQPVVRAILPGDTAAYTLSVTASEGFTIPVTLTLQNPPSGTTASFSPSAVTPPGTSRLYITSTAFTAAGIYPMTVTGTAGVLTDTTDLTLIVASETSSFTLSISPTARIAAPDQVISYTVHVTGVNGFNQPVTLAVVGLPTGVDPDWSVNPVTPGDSSTLTLSIPSKPSFAEHTLQVVGAAGTQFVAQGIRLIIDYPFKICLPIILKILISGMAFLR